MSARMRKPAGPDGPSTHEGPAQAEAEAAGMSAPPAVRGKQPPPENPADIRRRTYVILSFWLIVLLLGLPIWWKTTTIYRAELPLDEMMAWADGKVGTRTGGPA